MARAVRFHLVFSVVALALLSPGAAAALPAGQPLAAPPGDFASRLTGWLTNWWGDVGCSWDPNGRCGESLEVGCSMDPGGISCASRD